MQVREKEEQYHEALARILAEKGRTVGMAIKLTDGSSLQWPGINQCALVSWLTGCKATGQGVKRLFGNFYFSTFISPFDQSVSVAQRRNLERRLEVAKERIFY